jgi:uncharacterized Zn-binding protein involved in type VI secretion
MTEHGGVVMVGFPQVLIGMMPASRIGDMHVCPMVTGIVPHVGGPFVLGSMTVLVGMMPQSRVTDQLVCVGPPDMAAMGCETVLVGMSGAGGAGGAVAGIAAMGASVPMAPPPAGAADETAEMQQNGTLKYSAPPGQGLPPYTHAALGFPDLPGKAAANFQTAQPVDIPPGTTLYRVVGDPNSGAGSYWSPDVYPSEAAWREGCAVLPEWNNAGTLLALGVVQPPGLKAWAGAASRQGVLGGGGTQVWIPPGKLNPNSMFQSSWAAGAAQLQAAQQAAQAAQAAANQAQQAAAKGAAAAEKAVNEAKTAARQAIQSAQQAQQAAQQAAQLAKLEALQAQKAAQQAQQAAQQAVQSAKKAEQALPKAGV